ncbi:MAG: ThuA domain-containing protein [Verrucomicrobiota bacterium]
MIISRTFHALFFSVCATLALSLQAAEPPRKPHVFFLVGEPEYHTELTLPAFAKAELEPLGIQSTFSIHTDETTDEFPNLDSLPSSDLLLISTRRRHLPPEQLELIRTYIAAGKPVVGIRTASHAFGKRKGEDEGSWENFDKEILGTTYGGHYGTGLISHVKPLAEALRHPILTGFNPAEFTCPSHLYKNTILGPNVTILLEGHVEGEGKQEPVAWVNTREKQRIFYTSLGAERDFEVPQFRRLLLNGITWALGLPAPAEQTPPAPQPDPASAAKAQ